MFSLTKICKKKLCITRCINDTHLHQVVYGAQKF